MNNQRPGTPIGLGVVILDREGKEVARRREAAPHCLSVTGEILAATLGLQLALEMGLADVMQISDCATVYTVAEDHQFRDRGLAVACGEMLTLRTRFARCRVRRGEREEVQEAHWLATQARQENQPKGPQPLLPNHPAHLARERCVYCYLWFRQTPDAYTWSNVCPSCKKKDTD